MTILIFVNKNQTILFISFSGLSFFSIVLQAFYALRSLNTSLSKYNYHKHRTYFFMKILYLLINCIKLCLKTYDIYDLKDFALFIIDLTWTCMEAYWSLVLFMFFRRIKAGFYELFEGFLGDESPTRLVQYFSAIVLEIKGQKIKEKPSIIDPSFILPPENKKDKILLKEYKKKVYFFWREFYENYFYLDTPQF